MKFDQEWSEAISHLDARSQARLTEAIRHYQNTDTMPVDLDPASMMGFLFAKSVIDQLVQLALLNPPPPLLLHPRPPSPPTTTRPCRVTAAATRSAIRVRRCATTGT